ncbi:hypothetical protein ACWT_4813 [Actinoplanes sp. SE50]|uniref:hypothetical protein n=1 Tax=unclassified Actinoplanes TaxID=2626549 RepID=UPI00023EC300|nr:MULTISPECIES: hypothetical protein [unclassified Actinoplanes]AEV85832.1 hypothetical protein ACPL_4943 [Actinoplanes sp. SE50/110]ATO84228.1 hypothetical protein ACWT_4813 [Actinoplanes sp. SE50]SLM01638.1 hypothetical protein ACSP50_4874 [Actinoplanes sp. SE50/110]
MNDVDPEQYDEDTPGQERVPKRDAQEAHGGSMAPGLVDDTGHRTAEPLPGAPVEEPR